MKKINTLASAVSVILAFTACSGIGLQKDEPVSSAKEEIESPKVWKASIKATKGSDEAKTKALSEVGGSLNAFCGLYACLPYFRRFDFLFCRRNRFVFPLKRAGA